MSCNPYGTQEFADLVANWDRSAYELFCKRLEVLLLRGNRPGAIAAVKAICCLLVEEPPYAEQHVSEVFPIRTANALDGAGYSTVQSIVKAKDSDLAKIPNFGPGAIRQVDCVRVAYRNQKPLPKVIEDRANDVAPDYEIDWEFFGRIQPNPSDMTDDEIRKEMLAIKCRFEDLKKEVADRA